MSKKVETKETKLEKIRKSLKEAPTTTKVKAWTFQIEKQYYVIISYFVPRLGYRVGVYPSNKKGVKVTSGEILTIHNTQDYLRVFEEALKILLPADVQQEPSELSEAIS